MRQLRTHLTQIELWICICISLRHRDTDKDNLNLRQDVSIYFSVQLHKKTRFEIFLLTSCEHTYKHWVEYLIRFQYCSNFIFLCSQAVSTPNTQLNFSQCFLTFYSLLLTSCEPNFSVFVSFTIISFAHQLWEHPTLLQCLCNLQLFV